MSKAEAAQTERRSGLLTIDEAIRAEHDRLTAVACRYRDGSEELARELEAHGIACPALEEWRNA